MNNRHSYFIKIIKIICGTTIALAILLLLVFTNTGISSNIKLKNSKDRITDHPATIINNPAFFGRDESNHDYTITSEQTIQTDENIYKFSKIQGKYYLGTDHKEYVTLSAVEAISNSEIKDIELITDVEIVFSEGYRILTNKLNINLDSMHATTSQIVTVTGTKGKIIADNGLLLKSKEETIEFYGPVKTIIY